MKQHVLIPLLLMLLGVFGQAVALPIISLVPDSTKIHSGENLFIDVNVSGLQSGGSNSLLGAFSLDVLFNPELQFLPAGSGSNTWGFGLGDVGAGDAIFGGDISQIGSGLFSFYEVSLLDSIELSALQGDSFRLATLAFYLPYGHTLASGSSINFSTENVVLSDDFGDELITGVNQGATVQVPEPPMYLLLGIGLALLGYGNQESENRPNSRNGKNRSFMALHAFLSRPKMFSRKAQLGKLMRLLVGVGLWSCLLPLHAKDYYIQPGNVYGGDGLIAAINSANTSLLEADTIWLEEGDYTLTSVNNFDARQFVGPTGLPKIASNLRIVGKGSQKTKISADFELTSSSFRILLISPRVDLTIENLTLRGGNPNGGASGFGASAGGGIYNDGGTVKIINSVIDGNKATVGGGIMNSNDGIVSLIGTSVINNRVGGSGGGLLNGYDDIPNSLNTKMYITDSTLTGNESEDTGGGIQNWAGELAIQNSTISGNKARVGGGFFHYSGATEIKNSTFNENQAISGSNIYGRDARLGVSLQNTLIANGIISSNCDVGLISLGHNIDDDSSCELSAIGDIANVSPVLGPLQNNGGPTPTHALLTGSPAIDAGNSADCPPRDQRGVVRNRDEQNPCDIGAYEVGVLTTLDQVQVNGDANKDSPLLQLTNDAPSRVGSAFLPTPFTLSPNSVFHTNFTFRIGGFNLDSDQGSDGLAFVIQSDPRGASVLGNGGACLGYGYCSIDENPVDAIAPSVEIEFDTHQNEGDPNDNHVALLTDGNNFYHLADYSPSFSLNDGTPKYVWIDYVGASKHLDVFLSTVDSKPVAPAISTELDLAATVGNNAYFGFTAGTGGGFNSHEILAWKLDVVSSPSVGDFNGDSCVDQSDLRTLMAIVTGSGSKPLVFDLNGDGKVNVADSRKLVTLFTNSRGAACN